MNNSITLSILTCNSEKYIKKLFDSIYIQTIIPDEIIVVDSQSIDLTVEICKNYSCKIISIERNEFDHGKTRNIILEKASGEIVIFCTHDIIISDRHSVEKLIQPLIDNKNIIATYGRQVPHIGANYFACSARLFNYPSESRYQNITSVEKYGFKTIFLSDSFAAYKRSEVIKLGGFSTPIIFGEDTELAARIIKNKFTIVYNPDAVVKHSHNYNIRHNFLRSFDIGVFHFDYKRTIFVFGKPGNEGIKYLINEIKDLIKKKYYHLIPISIVNNSIKFIGYKIGYRYKVIPSVLRSIFSMNKGYWKYTKKRES